MESSEYRRRYAGFLERLRLARVEAGLTQLETSRLLNKPQSYVSKCEVGERRVDFVELLEFARIYGKSISYFQQGVEVITDDMEIDSRQPANVEEGESES